jgi:PAS domain S-box-containing protein
MPPFALVELLSCIIAAMLGAGVIARDPGLRVNRLTGMLVLCISFWALCEAVWNSLGDPALVVLGWMGLAPFAYHIFLEITGMRGTALYRSLPITYVATATSILLYIITPWCLVEAVPTSWGWGYRLGPLFPLVYLATVIPPMLVLLNWRRGRLGQGSAMGTAAASITDVLLPWLGINVPRLGAISLTGVSLVVAWYLLRYGFFLLSPVAFAQEILDTLGDGVALLHPDGRIRHANSALERLVGTASGGLRGSRMRDLLPQLSRISGSSPRDVETELACSAGDRIPVSISATTLVRDGSEMMGTALVVRDLREVANLRRRLVTSGRLAAVGELSAGIAHEIKHPIAEVRRNLGELRREWGRLKEDGTGAQDEESEDASGALALMVAEGEELIDECLEGADRVAAIVRDVAGFARAGPSESEIVDSAPLVEHAVRIAGPRVPPKVRIELDLVKTEPIRCTPQEFEQVILNLLQNALHAVAGGGNILVTNHSRGGRVQIRIQDDGPGIEPELRDRIFDPFFTTKPVGEGTGLGLAISCQIIRNHGGEIRVSSAEGGGAVFTIDLPAARDADE